MLPTPGFHHLHLNSVDPDAAIEWYTRQFPSCTKGEWAGFPALLSPNNVMVLFTKVAEAPPTTPQSAIWHFGWHVTDVRGSLAGYQERGEVNLLPLYTTDEGGSVLVSSDTWPNVGGVLGLITVFRRRLWPAIGAHMAIDAFGLLAIRVLKPLLERLLHHAVT